MIVNLKELILTNQTNQFVSYIKSQMIDLYSQLTECNDIPNNNFLSIVNKSNIFIKINEKNQIMGAITLLIECKIIHNGQNVCHIEDLVVNEQFRNTGVATELLFFSLDYAKKNNCYKSILDCRDTLEEYYNKFGFENKNIQMSKYFL